MRREEEFLASLKLPDNASRYNNYASFDRGLFLIERDGAKAGRIHAANWVTWGDTEAPGVLSYQVELFREVPSLPHHLIEYSLGASPETFTCGTRTICDNPVMIEEYAIRHFKSGERNLNPDEITTLMTLGRNLLTSQTVRVIEQCETRLTFASSETSPLAVVEASITFRARIVHVDETSTVVSDTIIPSFDEIRPGWLVRKYLRDYVRPPVIPV